MSPIAVFWAYMSLTLSLFAELAHAIDGEASFTGGNLSGGTCSFANYSFPTGLSGVGLGPANWASGSKCGTCFRVRGPKGSTTVMLPPCSTNRLNLFSDAFYQIADPSDGIVSVTYETVPCGITKPITVRNKVGTSRWHFSMQVLDCNYPITALDVSTDGARTWLPTVRRDYNYFEKEGGTAGFEKDSVAVRNNCSNGRQVVLATVSAASEAVTVASGNC